MQSIANVEFLLKRISNCNSFFQCIRSVYRVYIQYMQSVYPVYTECILSVYRVYIKCIQSVSSVFFRCVLLSLQLMLYLQQLFERNPPLPWCNKHQIMEKALTWWYIHLLGGRNTCTIVGGALGCLLLSIAIQYTN